jgi:hypothetical protein
VLHTSYPGDISGLVLPNGEKLPERFLHPIRNTWKLLSYANIPRSSKTYLDVSDASKYIEETGEIITPEGQVIAKVEPIKSTSPFFRWSAVVMIASVSVGVAGLGLWWVRRRG